MRSGTSVLQAVLCSTADTNPQIHEAQYFTRLVYLYKYSLETFDRYLCHYFDDLEELKACHADLMLGFLDRTLQRYRPAAHLVLKNPEMTPLFPEISGLVEDAKFVVVIRDPRDTIASILEVARKQAEQGQITNLTQMADDAEKYANHYNSYYAALFNNGNPDFIKRLLFVKYEALVQNTESVVATLAEFTGLPLQGFDASQPWRTLVDYTDEKLTSEPFHSELRGKPLSKDRIGHYAKHLAKEDIETIEQACGRFMDRFGYAR